MFSFFKKKESKADMVWNYINFHQDENYCNKLLEKEFGLDESLAKDCIIRWAMDDKEWFNSNVK